MRGENAKRRVESLATRLQYGVGQTAPLQVPTTARIAHGASKSEGTFSPGRRLGVSTKLARRREPLPVPVIRGTRTQDDFDPKGYTAAPSEPRGHTKKQSPSHRPGRLDAGERSTLGLILLLKLALNATRVGPRYPRPICFLIE